MFGQNQDTGMQGLQYTLPPPEFNYDRYKKKKKKLINNVLPQNTLWIIVVKIHTKGRHHHRSVEHDMVHRHNASNGIYNSTSLA